MPDRRDHPTGEYAVVTTREWVSDPITVIFFLFIVTGGVSIALSTVGSTESTRAFFRTLGILGVGLGPLLLLHWRKDTARMHRQATAFRLTGFTDGIPVYPENLRRAAKGKRVALAVPETGGLFVLTADRARRRNITLTAPRAWVPPPD